MNSEPISAHASDDLDWLAFCYIADEMTEVEEREFELRMEHDQSVRDAVARAQELGELTYGGFDSLRSTEPVHSDRVVSAANVCLSANRFRRQVPGILFAAAVCISLVAVGWVWQMSHPSHVETALTMEVADVWSQLAVWDDRNGELPVRESLFSEDDLWLNSQLGNNRQGQLTPTVAADERVDDLNDESSNWMLLALIDLEYEQETEAK